MNRTRLMKGDFCMQVMGRGKGREPPEAEIGLLDGSRREDQEVKNRAGENGRRCLTYTGSRVPDCWTANH